MTINAVGILSPGDMGHAVGQVLVEHGMIVYYCPEGRSERTCGLAKKAGIKIMQTYEDMIQNTDIILSILVPSEAKNAAINISHTLEKSGKQIIYVDCNAIAPITVKETGEPILNAGSCFIDAGIIGGPPSLKSSPRIYASGKDAEELKKLSKYGLNIITVGKEIGQASGLKMVYAAMTKGTSALSIELLVAAWRMGLYEALIKEWQSSQPERYGHLSKSLQSVPSKAKRWIGEMEEIAKTFSNVDLTPKILEGTADLYRFVGNNPVFDETPESYNKNRTLEELIQALAESKK
ncbi:DUF1932 domain-containing protein [Chloroflexota bacterium]